MVKAVKPLLHLLVHRTKLSMCQPSLTPGLLNSSCEIESCPPRHRSQPGSSIEKTLPPTLKQSSLLAPLQWQETVQSRRSPLAGSVAFSTVNTNLTPLSTTVKGPRVPYASLPCFLHYTVTPLAKNGLPFKGACIFFSEFLISCLDFSHNYG